MNAVPILIALLLLGVAGFAVHMARQRQLSQSERQRTADMSASLTAAQRDHSELASELGRLRRTEADLLESESFSRALFDSAHAGLMVIEAESRQILDANAAAARILDRPADDLLGEIANKEMLGGTEEQHCLPDDRTPVHDIETTVINASGDRIPVLRSATPLTSSQNNLWVVSFLDISAQKKVEEQLRESFQQLEQANGELKHHKDQMVQSEKLASIGQLAAGVAHEINNPVGYVTSNLGTIREYSETMKKLLEMYGRWGADPAAAGAADLAKEIEGILEEEDLDFVLDDIDNVLNESQEGVERVAEIVQNLKSFAREDSLEKRDHDINEGVESMIKMVWNEIKYSCEMKREFGEVPTLQCHAGQVNQVIMNMLVNASQAMGEAGGTITVGTAVVDDDVEIRISDTGCGIPPDKVSRIFDPFFTTKDVGKGTGLGLSISHGIIHDHGGRIEVDSVVGEGTTFRIYLPLAPVATDVIT